MRLILGFSLQIGLTIIIASIGISGLVYEQKRSDETMTLVALADRAESAFRTEIQEWKNTLLRGADPALFQKHEAARRGKSREADQLLRELLNKSPDTESRTKIQSLLDAHANVTLRYSESLQALYRGTPESASAVDLAVRGIDRAPSEAFSGLVEVLSARKRSEDDATRTLITSILLGTGGVFLLFGGVLAWVTIRRIEKPLALIRDRISRLAAGDLSGEVVVTAKDEFGSVARDVATAVLHVASVVNGASAASEELAATSEEMLRTSRAFARNAQTQAAHAEEIAATMQEAQAGVESVASASRTQSSQVVRVAETFSNLTTQIRAAEKQLDEALQAARDSAAAAARGESALHQMEASMDRIKSGSTRIKEITDEVIGISERVDLLSLNASIEAARAGDAGRGFAVVAAEIGRLSDQTATTVDEIARITGDSENSIRSGSSALTDVLAVLADLTRTINGSRVIMETLSESVSRQQAVQASMSKETETARTGAASVEAALSEQRTAISEVVGAVTTISEMTQANARGAEELSSGAEAITRIAETIQSRMAFFRTRGSSD